MVFGNWTQEETKSVSKCLLSKKKGSKEDAVTNFVKVVEQRLAHDKELKAFGSIGPAPQPAVRTLVVLQREVGTLPSFGKNGNPSTTALIRHIASIDATSCIIVGLYSKHGSSVAHFDSPGEVILKGLGQMIASLAQCKKDTIKRNIAELTEGREEETEEDGQGSADTQQATALRAEMDEKLVVSLNLVGGAVEYKHALPAIVSLLESVKRVNEEMGESVVVNLNFSGCCFWSLNTTSDRKANHTGLAIDVDDGSCYPMPTVVGLTERQAAYPQALLRGLACFSDDRHQQLSWVSLKVATKSDGSKTGDVLPSYKGQFLEDVVVAVRPFSWNAFPPHVLRLPRDEYLKWSTTPLMEAPDFPEVMKGCLIFANTQTATGVFGPERKAVLYYRYNPDVDTWVPLELLLSSSTNND